MVAAGDRRAQRRAASPRPPQGLSGAFQSRKDRDRVRGRLPPSSGRRCRGSYGGTDRYFCTYTPPSLDTTAATTHPLIVALHGGSGNASQMMQDDVGIIAAADSMEAIAVFPNGLPRSGCGAATLCLNNGWGEPDDVFFIAELIDRQKATGHVLEDRVHLVGFSGGATQIYEIVATPGFPHALHSVATVAGGFGLYSADHADHGFEVKQLHEGTPVSVPLVQGGDDPKLPPAGGLDTTGREAHVSFRTKVDYWRLVTGTQRGAAAGRRAGVGPERPSGSRSV